MEVPMLTAFTLLIGFMLGYGVRSFVSSQRRAEARRRYAATQSTYRRESADIPLEFRESTQIPPEFRFESRESTDKAPARQNFAAAAADSGREKRSRNFTTDRAARSSFRRKSNFSADGPARIDRT
jgi:hypothetical protein